jgi:hypothetical protein
MEGMDQMGVKRSVELGELMCRQIRKEHYCLVERHLVRRSAISLESVSRLLCVANSYRNRHFWFAAFGPAELQGRRNSFFLMVLALVHLTSLLVEPRRHKVAQKRDVASSGLRIDVPRSRPMLDFVQETLSCEQIVLLRAAFEAAWQFVKGDSTLDSVSMSDRQAALANAVIAVAAHGEQEVLRVANDAIGRVRKLYAPSPGAREDISAQLVHLRLGGPKR